MAQLFVLGLLSGLLVLGGLSSFRGGRVLGGLSSFRGGGDFSSWPTNSNLPPSRTRSHSFSYVDPWTNQRVSRTILMAAPTPLRKRRLIYHDPHPDPRLDFNDPDNGEAFDVPDSENRECRPMASWQTSNHQSCNKMYELIFDEDTRFVSCGNTRCTFLFAGHEGEQVILKMVNIEHDFSSEKYKMSIKDSLALEKLTSSPYVIDIYGACAITQLVEYSSGGNMHDLLKRQRIQEQIGDGPLGTTERHHPGEGGGQYGDPAHYKRHQLASPLTKLKIAYQVSMSVADMHAVEEHPDGLPSLVNNDLCCHQYNLVNGVYKLGDFDWGTLMTVTSAESSKSVRGHKAKEEACQTTPIGFAPDYLKQLAPEELLYYDYADMLEEHQLMMRKSEWERRSADNPEPGTIWRDKLDVYQVGTMLYHLLTNWWVWEGYTTAHTILAEIQVRTV